MEPRWKIAHNYWMDDFEFEIEQQEEIKNLIRKHPDDDMGKCFRDTLKCLEKKFNSMIRGYQKIYGSRPPGLITMRRQISERYFL